MYKVVYTQGKTTPLVYVCVEIAKAQEWVLEWRADHFVYHPRFRPRRYFHLPVLHLQEDIQQLA
jgi:hypothetical protein